MDATFNPQTHQEASVEEEETKQVSSSFIRVAGSGKIVLRDLENQGITVISEPETAGLHKGTTKIYTDNKSDARLVLQALEATSHAKHNDVWKLVRTPTVVPFEPKSAVSSTSESQKTMASAESDTPFDWKKESDRSSLASQFQAMIKLQSGPQVVDRTNAAFGPYWQGCLTLPDHVVVKFINRSNVNELRVLVGARFIGMDVEWKPVFVKGQSSRAALFQLATEDKVFLVDLIDLAQSRELNDILGQAFSHVGTICIGFAFSSDLSVFNKSLPQMNFFRHFHRFLDVQSYYKQVIGRNTGGLKKVVENTLGEPLCKKEQCSNWERRPLTPGQMHYAALDAFCLVNILQILEQQAMQNLWHPVVDFATVLNYNKNEAGGAGERNRNNRNPRNPPADKPRTQRQQARPQY